MAHNDNIWKITDSGWALLNGAEIVAQDFNEAEWTELKTSYAVGDYKMPCCQATAIPKTSPNGLQFFAHHHGECSTAPETLWHKKGKGIITSHLQSMGIECKEEFPGRTYGRKWEADTYFEFSGRKLVVEIQHSYQHLDEYLRRQKQYELEGIEAYWLLPDPRYYTLLKAMAKRRIKLEFGGKFLPQMFGFPCIREVPVAVLETEPAPQITGAGFFRASVTDWLVAIMEQRYYWEKGKWDIRLPV